jgi:DNA-binding SARP family transcriptional activator
MELLWPEADPSLASNRLSVLLSTVREVLQPQPIGEGPLITNGGAVSINPTQVRVDVEEFLTQATAALDADRADESDATTHLTTAVAAHTGDFLEDDPYHEWGTTLAEEVRATYIALLRALASRLRDAGDTDAAVRYILRLLEQDPYDIGGHLNLIKTLLNAGRFGQAHHHYRNYVDRMKQISVKPHSLSELT